MDRSDSLSSLVHAAVEAISEADYPSVGLISCKDLYERFCLLIGRHDGYRLPTYGTFIKALRSLGYTITMQDKKLGHILLWRRLLSKDCWTPDCAVALERYLGHVPDRGLLEEGPSNYGQDLIKVTTPSDTEPQYVQRLTAIEPA